MSATAPELTVSVDTVVPYLTARGLRPGTNPRVTALTDGVSAIVLLVETDQNRWVVKQALAELLVEQHWQASTDRSVTEARALKLAHQLSPENVPDVIDIDETHPIIVMTAAPASLANWRRLLLDPHFDGTALTETAERLGQLLGLWHRDTWGRADIAATFNDDETFELLRLAPFHRAVRPLHPEVAGAIDSSLSELESRRDCLVHGDFSPKNILVGDDRVIVLDFEVARVGAAVFDLAFFGHHLALKAIVHSGRAGEFRAAFERFLATYRAAVSQPVDLSLLGWHLATLLLARVDGVSPAGYLTVSQRERARAAALDALGSESSDSTTFWRLVCA